MRLLSRNEHQELVLSSFPDSEVPTYAILSHTWIQPDSEEFTFKDFSDKVGKDKTGFDKIIFCLNKAEELQIKHVWVDTCCINQDSSAELSMSIISMFRWYQKAAACFVYLSDVSTSSPDCLQESWENAFRESRWWKRGWTLQELLAPKEVTFFSREGHRLGTKTSLERIIHEITNLPIDALRAVSMRLFPYDVRRSWAKGRETTKPEDKVYCLLGILEISLSVLYGEGLENAVARAELAIQQKVHASRPSLLGKRKLAEFVDDSADSPSSQLTRPRSSESQSISDERVRDLLESLKFEQIEVRQHTIKKAWAKTCQWLFKNQQYKKWRNDDLYHEHHGFLWIKGKPGSGKSTLMKFAVVDAKKKMKGTLQLAFFFNARGDDLEKSVVGCYRTLLLQLFEQRPDMKSVFENFGLAVSSVGTDCPWDENLLEDLLGQALQGLSDQPVEIYIDALDECKVDEIRAMIRFFEGIGEDSSTSGGLRRICLASRPYPHITPKWGINLVLEGNEGHTHDIQSYLASELRIGHTKQAEDIRARLFEKASGIFMWVVLVVTILNKEYDKGNTFALKKRLEVIPADLHKLFHDMLTRNSDNKEDMLLCVQWILFAKSPLNPQQLYHAIRVGVEDAAPQGFDPDEATPEAIRLFLLSSSKGLAEQTSGNKPTVQFIHESVRDFLLKERGLDRLLGTDEGDVRSRSHDRIHQICIKYFGAARSGTLSLPQELPTASSAEAKALRAQVSVAYPLLDYTASNLFFHGENATNIGIYTQAVLHEHSTAWYENWRDTRNLMVPFGTQRLHDSDGLVYVLAKTGHPLLLRRLLQDLPSKSCRAENYHQAFYRATERNETATVKALLEVGRHDGLSPTQDLLLQEKPFKLICRSRQDIVTCLMDAGSFKVLSDKGGRDALNKALIRGVESNLPDLVVRLIAEGADVNNWTSRQETLLNFALRNNNNEIAELLITNGADVNLKDSMELGITLGYSALQTFCEYTEDRTVSLAKLLIERGANVHAQSSLGITALQDLVSRPRAACLQIAKLFVENGARINHSDNLGRNTLHRACEAITEHSMDVIQFLINRGAHMNRKGTGSKSPLLHALLHNSLCKYRDLQITLDVAKLLIRYGADLRDKDERGYTALHILLSGCQSFRNNSTMSRISELICFLIEAGADVNERDLEGRVVLHGLFAANSFHPPPVATVKLLIKYGAKVDARDHRGRSPLLTLCSQRFASDAKALTLVEVLLESGADIHAFSESNTGSPSTALAAASRQGAAHIVQFLLQKGAAVNEQHSESCTALQAACRSGSVATVKMLLDSGAEAAIQAGGATTLTSIEASLKNSRDYEEIACMLLDKGSDVNAKGTSTGTALWQACFWGHIWMITFLISRGAKVHGNVKFYLKKFMRPFENRVTRKSTDREIQELIQDVEIIPGDPRPESVDVWTRW